MRPTLIGRIQEKIAPQGTPSEPRFEAREAAEADWILERIRNTRSHFQRLALQNGWQADTEDAESRTRAFLLAYKLTLAAWRRHAGRPATAVLGHVRRCVLHEIGGGPVSTRQLETADSDVATAVLRFEAGLPGPLTPFYGDLAPAFGGPCPTPELAGRYGKVVRHLFEGLERRVEERLRSGPSGLARYAGAG